MKTVLLLVAALAGVPAWALDLHDTLAQGIAGARPQMEAGLDALDRDPGGAREHFALATAMARASQAEVQRSIWVLRAQVVKGGDGLAAALAESLRPLTAGTHLDSTIAITGPVRRLPLVAEHNLLRIVQELVLNAVRHSGAARLWLALRFGGDAVELAVRDDGRGFDPHAHRAASGVEHFGLLGMRERAESLGGRLDLRSRPGSGTEVLCRLPYDGPAQREGAGPL